MHDDAPVAFLDNVWKHSKRRRQAGVSVWEDIIVRAFSPGGVYRCVDGIFDVSTVEVKR